MNGSQCEAEVLAACSGHAEEGQRTPDLAGSGDHDRIVPIRTRRVTFPPTSLLPALRHPDSDQPLYGRRLALNKSRLVAASFFARPVSPNVLMRGYPVQLGCRLDTGGLTPE